MDADGRGWEKRGLEREGAEGRRKTSRRKTQEKREGSRSFEFRVSSFEFRVAETWLFRAVGDKWARLAVTPYRALGSAICGRGVAFWVMGEGGRARAGTRWMFGGADSVRKRWTLVWV